jgi:hypothetical protein
VLRSRLRNTLSTSGTSGSSDTSGSSGSIPKINKEGSKEEAPFAPLTTPRPDPSDDSYWAWKWLPEDASTAQDWSSYPECFQSGIASELDKLATDLGWDLWFKHTGYGFVHDETGYDDVVLAKILINVYGYDEVRQVLEDTLVNIPSKKMLWQHFKVFAKNYELNRKKSLAYRRESAATAKRKVANATATATAKSNLVYNQGGKLGGFLTDVESEL